MSLSIASSPPARGRRSLLACSAALAGALAVCAPAAAQTSPFDEMIVFGDSISDGGSYADRAPPGAGRFTTNPDPVWVEVIAGRLGLDLAPHATAGGTNYAEGGARVAVPRDNAPGNLSRQPVTQQIDDFLGGGGKLGAGSLVIVQGGGNDVFATQANGPGFTPADLAVLDKAANDLADQLQRLDRAGAGTLVTVSVPKFDVFNDRYEAAVAARDLNVLYFDVAGLVGEIEADPAGFGLVNVIDPACRGTALESFTCLPQDYVTPDANRTYLYADRVHFTGVVHEIEGQALLATLRAPGQVSQLAYVAQSDGQARRAALDAQLQAAQPGPGALAVFGTAGATGFDIEGSGQHVGLAADSGRADLGVEYGLGAVSVGAAVGWSRVAGDFQGEAGGFEGDIATVTAFGRGRVGRLEARVDAAYGTIAYDEIERRIALGPAVRSEVGETAGHMVSMGGELALESGAGPWRIGPMLGLRYDSIRLDGYAETGERSTGMSFGGQELETLTASLGLRVQWAAPGGSVRPFATAAYETELLDREATITVTPQGAPTSFTTAAYAADGDYVSYGLGVETWVSDRIAMTIAFGGIAGRGPLDAVSGVLGLRTTF